MKKTQQQLTAVLSAVITSSCSRTGLSVLRSIVAILLHLAVLR